MRDLAYQLADCVRAMWESPTVQQQAFGMEPCEFREMIAGKMEETLGRYGTVKPRNRRGRPLAASVAPAEPVQHEPEDAPPSNITPQAAVQILENAEPAVREKYRELRSNGATAADALHGALKLWRELQESAALAQVAAEEIGDADGAGGEPVAAMEAGAGYQST